MIAKQCRKLFGNISDGKIMVSKKSSKSTYSTDTSSSAKNLDQIDLAQSGNSRSVTGIISLNRIPSFQSKFDVNSHYPHIACVEQGLAWVRTGKSTIQLVDRGGTAKDTLILSFDILDMARTLDGNILLADRKNKCIKSLSVQQQISTLLKTSGLPYGLCCLQNGGIVVAFSDESNVIVYSNNYQIKQSMNHIRFRFPKKVAQNKVNKDIYICDHEGNTYDSPGKIIAVGIDLNVRYEYNGQGDKTFTPVGVCTDQMGHILITDYINHRIHILDQEGRFIQHIMTPEQGLHMPNAIDVDLEGNLWLGKKSTPSCRVIYGTTDVFKVAKYLKRGSLI